jgi:hypothetical protein
LLALCRVGRGPGDWSGGAAQPPCAFPAESCTNAVATAGKDQGELSESLEELAHPAEAIKRCAEPAACWFAEPPPRGA